MDLTRFGVSLILLATGTPHVNSLPTNTEAAETAESEILHANLPVSELGIHFNETLSYDPVESLVTFHVPKHHQLAEHVTIMHPPSGKSLTFLPEHSLCQLKDIPREIDPVDTFSTLAVLDTLPMQVEATADNSDTTGFIDVTLGLASPDELADLPDNMTKLCHGLPVHRVASIEAVGENILSDQLLPVEPSTEHARRVKRQGGGMCDLTYWIGSKSSDCPSCITCLYATCSLTNPDNHSNHGRCIALLNANRSFKHLLGLRNMVGALCCNGATHDIGDVEGGDYLCACATIAAAKKVSTAEYRRVFKRCQCTARKSYGDVPKTTNC